MNLNLPNDIDKLSQLHIGQVVYYTGKLYTARDAAHQKILDLLNNNEPLPVDFQNSFIYYAGPTPTKPGSIIGSIGPTTSARMDKFCKMMPTLGILATIGKGPRDKNCEEYYIKHKILYFVATGGCGALLSKCVKKAEEIAFMELGPESIKELYVEDFPLIVAIDQNGNSIFSEEQ